MSAWLHRLSASEVPPIACSSKEAVILSSETTKQPGAWSLAYPGKGEHYFLLSKLGLQKEAMRLCCSNVGLHILSLTLAILLYPNGRLQPLYK